MGGSIAPSAQPHALYLKSRLRKVALVAALGVVGYLILAVLSDAPAIQDGLERLEIRHWLALLGLSLANYALRFLRWHAYLQALDARVPVGRDMLIYIAGFAFTITPGKAGEAVRSVYLNNAGVPWSQGLAALAVERLLDLMAIVMLAGLSLQFFADQALPALLLVIAMVGILVVATRAAVITRLLDSLPDRGRLVGLKSGVFAVLDHSHNLLLPRRLIGGMALGAVAWAAEAWGFFLLLGWLGVDTELMQAIGIYALSMLTGAISFLPGGLGGAEAAMVTLLAMSGAVLGTAVLATLICRLVTLWFAVLLGIGAVLLLSCWMA